MSPGADLFVVCKHCGSEVSPYITECPYCGHRLRRRAPKLPREGAPAPSSAWRARPDWLEIRRGRRTRSAAAEAGAPAVTPVLAVHGRLGGAAVRDDRAGRGQLRRCGCWCAPDYVARRQARDRRTAARRLVEALQRPVRPTSTAGMRSLRCCVIAIFGWLLERVMARSSCSRCSSAPAPRERSSRSRSTPLPVVVGGNAGALGADRRLGGARSARRASGRLLRGRPARRWCACGADARDSLRSLRGELAGGVVGGAIGLLVGLGLPRAEHVRM